MTTPTHLAGNYVGIVVPDDAVIKGISNGFLEYETWTSATLHNMISLPPARYKFIYLSEEATEEDARRVVGKFHDNDGLPGYYNYLDECKTLWSTALESLSSLLKSKQLSGNVAILEILK